MASLQVVSTRVEQADADHDHVDLVGYHSNHIAAEPIMLSTERTLQRMSLGDRFFILVDGEETDVIEGTCPVCGYAPYLRTKADQGEEQKLMALPQG